LAACWRYSSLGSLFGSARGALAQASRKRNFANGTIAALRFWPIAIVGGMLWHVFLVASANRLPRQDVDHSPVYERMDTIINK
jgi:hypothetical protein